MDGGSQERNMRGGTENLYGIVWTRQSAGIVYHVICSRPVSISQIFKQYMKGKLDHELDDVMYNGYTDDRCHYKVLNVSLPLNNKEISDTV
jgi:cysteine desulfurase